MSARVSAVQGYLLSDAQDHPLPSPQPLDLATDVIPYGARLRLDATVESAGPVHPLLARVTGPEVLSGVYMFSTDGGLSFSQGLRIPTDFVYGETHGVSAPLRFPIPEWPGGHLPPAGGECLLQICPVPVGTRPTWPFGDFPPLDGPLPTFEARFRVGDPPAAGGAAPRIVAVEGEPPEGRVRIGEPWLVTARVEDADDDVLGVLFCVVRGGVAMWSRCDPAEAGGAGEVSYSILRVGGDVWDRWGAWGDAEDVIVFSLQAVDLRGNWSEPAVMEYALRRDAPPLWMDEPVGDGPNITAAGADRDQGLFDHPRVWARCDRSDAWVCARVITQPDQVWPLWGDPRVAGGHFCTMLLDRPRHLDVVFYAVPKTGPKTIGAKMAATCPPVA